MEKLRACQAWLGPGVHSAAWGWGGTVLTCSASLQRPARSVSSHPRYRFQLRPRSPDCRGLLRSVHTRKVCGCGSGLWGAPHHWWQALLLYFIMITSFSTSDVMDCIVYYWYSYY